MALTATRPHAQHTTPSPTAREAPTRAAIASRFASLDTVRGLVIVLMALDHVRDFFSSARFDPLDLLATTPAYFVTRWVTHFCAPVFVLLAGVGAYLYGTRGRSTGQTAWFLFTRGLWLVALELTVVHYGWYGTFDLRETLAQVIWAIGWSMVGLAGLIALGLPPWAMGGFSVALIAGHNLLDGLDPARFGALAPLWRVLHAPGMVRLAPGYSLRVLYPLVPWVGVLAAGYALGALWRRPVPERRRWLAWLGGLMTAAFFLLRVTNLYGDPQPWHVWSQPLLSLFDFLNVEKYPPSLLYLLITLGPALLLLAWLEGRERLGPVGRFFGTFGRVPLFFYVLHLLLIRALRWGVLPGGPGWELPVVYLAWLGVVAALWPACYAFARLKARRSEGWLSYL
jgi:uncharacterized membrane protein